MAFVNLSRFKLDERPLEVFDLGKSLKPSTARDFVYSILRTLLRI